MSENLYASGGLIRIELIEKALNNAKNEGKLNGVPSFIILKFAECFREMLEEPGIKGRIGSQITAKEVDFVIDRMKRDKTDQISDQHLEKIRDILTDQGFDIE